jgi:hypothetical protein
LAQDVEELTLSSAFSVLAGTTTDVLPLLSEVAWLLAVDVGRLLFFILNCLFH